MSFKNTVVEFIIKGRDLFSSAADKAKVSAEQLAQQSKALNDELKNIESVQGQVKRYSELASSLDDTKAAYDNANAALKTSLLEQKAANATLKQTEQAYNQLKAEVAALAEKEKQSTQGTNQFNAALKDKRLALSKLEQDYNQAVKATGDFNLKVKAARSEVNQLGSTVNKNQAEFTRLEKSLKSTGINLDKLGNESKELSTRQNFAKIAIAETNAKLAKQQQVLNEAGKSAQSFGGSIGAATKSLVAMAGAYVGVDSLKQSLFGILNAGDKAKAFEAQMTAAMGSIEKGREATAWINEFANTTGTQLDAVKTSFATLKTFGIDPMNGSLQSLVDYNAKLGGSQEKLEGIILAVGQAWAKQKLQGEEILQLVERGVPVWDLLAKVTGKNTVELQKLSESGQLGRDTIAALMQELGSAASGQASQSLNRLSGQLALISNKWEEFKIRIADSGVYQVAVNFLQELNAKFDELVQSGKLEQAAQKVSDFFAAIVRDGGSAITSLVQNVSTLVSVTEQIIGAIRIPINGFTAGVKSIGFVVTEFFHGVAQSVASTLDLIGADEWAAKAQFQADALRSVSKGFLESIAQDGEDLRNAWEQLSQTQANDLVSSQQAASKVIGEESAKQQAAISNVGAAGAQAGDDISLAMSKAGITTTNSLEQAAQSAKQLYSVLLEQHKQGVVGAYEVEQAYLKWAQASIKVAEATKSGVDPQLQSAAAALKMNDALQQLINKSSGLNQSVASSSREVLRYAQALEQTQAKIAEYKRIINDTTASIEAKTNAHKQLAQAQNQLRVQTEHLNAVKKAESANYYQLNQLKTEYLRKVELLNQQMRYGTLTGAAYREQKEQLASVLNVINGLLGDFAYKQDDATDATIRATAATKAAVEADKDAANALAERTAKLDGLSSSFQSATRNASSFNRESGLGHNSEGNRTFTTYDPKIAERERIEQELAEKAQKQYEQYKGKIDAAKGNANALNKLYTELNTYLLYMTRDQRRELLELVKQLRNQPSQSSSAPRSNSVRVPTNNTPQNGGGGNNTNQPNNSEFSQLISVLKQSPLVNSKAVTLELVLPSGKRGTAITQDRNLISELEALNRTQ